MNQKTSKKKLSEVSFAKRFEKLEEIHHEINNIDENNIETMLSLYEKGTLLARSLEADIASYEHRIQEIQSEKYDEAEESKEKKTSTKKAPAKKAKTDESSTEPTGLF